jgi:hypothetical protein
MAFRLQAVAAGGITMRIRATIAALLFPPFLAVAEPAAAPAAAETRPAGSDWTFGTGVGFAVLDFRTPVVVSSSLLGTSTFVPIVGASLEHRVSDRTWLVLGVFGAVTRNRDEVPEGEFGTSRDDSRQLYVTAGVRRPLTRAGAPVEVSAVVLAEGGVVDADQRIVRSTDATSQDVTSWLAGANAGIAIDRELTGGLSLRVASPLVGVRYMRSTIDVAGQPGRSASDVSVQALLAPRLELRLAF